MSLSETQLDTREEILETMRPQSIKTEKIATVLYKAKEREREKRERERERVRERFCACVCVCASLRVGSICGSKRGKDGFE